MTSFASARTLRRFVLPIVLLAGCGGRPLNTPNGSAASPDEGDAGSPGAQGGTSGAGVSGTAGVAGHAGTAGVAGVAGHAGTAGVAGVAGHAGATPDTVTVGDTGTLVFAPGSAVFAPHEINDELFRGGNYSCGPIPPYDASGGLAVSLLGFGLSGDPGCNLFISLVPVIPFNTPITVFPGPPVMVSFTAGPNGEIIDPSFDVGVMMGSPYGGSAITLDLGQGLRMRPLISGGVTLTLRAWPQKFGDSIRLRVQATLADGGFLDFEVTKVLVAPKYVDCSTCNGFCQQ